MMATDIMFAGYGVIKRANLIGFHPPEIPKKGPEHDELANEAIRLMALISITLSGRDAICVGQHGLMAMISTGVDRQQHHVLTIARDMKKLIMTFQPGSNIITKEYKYSLFQVPTKYDPQFVLASIDFLKEINS